MAIALVNHGVGNSSDSNGFTTGSIDTTGANFIVVGFAAGSSGGTLTDSKSNTWNKLTERLGGLSDRFYTLIYAENATVGTGHTFSITGTSNFPSLTVAAFSGVATSSSFDVENGNGVTFLNTLSTGSITPGSANELVIAGLGYDDSPAATVDSGLTITDALAGGGFGYTGNVLAYIIETTATAKNPAFSWTNNSRAVAAIASFKAAATATFIGKGSQSLQAVKRASYW